MRNQTHFKKQLEQVYHTLELGIPLEPFDASNLKPGELVEVVSGPMRGIRGTIQRIHSTHKLIISVDILGKAAVNVDASCVKPL